MENIYSTVKPFYFFAKVLGVFPLTLVGTNLKPRKFDCVLASASFAALVALIYLMLNFEIFIKSDSSILTKASKFSVVLGLYLLLISFWFQICKRNAIKQFLAILSCFDYDVSGLSNN